MKKLVRLLVALMVMMCFSITAFASKDADRMVDEAGLLTADQEAKLEEKLDKISEEYKVDVVILTVDSLGGKSATAYADDYFDYNGYGLGKKKSGILLLVSMEERDWATSTKGIMYSVVYPDDDSLYELEDTFLSYLSAGSYYSAFDAFANKVEADVKKATAFPVGRYVGIALFIGLMIGLIGILIMKSKLKSVAPNNKAQDYAVRGSLRVNGAREIYLYRNVTSRTIQRSTSSGGGGHISSSGSVHGGHSGKF